MIKKISILSLLILSNFNNNLNSMQIIDENIKQNLTLLKLPEEIIQLIIYKIIDPKLIEPYIEKIKKIDNIFDLYSIEIEYIKKKLKKELINISLTSRSLRYSVSDIIEYAINQIQKISKEKEKELRDNIKSEYEDLDEENLNNKLKQILNQNYQNRFFLEEAIKLIIAGASVNLKNEINNKTTLINVARFGHKDLVKLLLNHKDININIKDNDGHTALIWTIIQGHQEIFKLLINKGADINTINNNGQTALMIAIIHMNKYIIELLLNHKDIDINVKDDWGQTALIWATIKGYKYIVSLLLNQENINFNIQDRLGRTALIRAIIYGYKKIVTLLLNQENIDLDIKDRLNRNALIIAKKLDRKDIVKLIEAKLNK